ncbi:hypothetical protein SAMN04487996_107119 [Dyadobacter soli]|uniref:Uncharacterized protein n=1 Tax=Dyadobacter soli TaxID=659014 RepID=A0A1G7G4E7_9BACT|nr:hypothetical protein [Dyadobacter soli]SDE82998.1 hypothetical protein SAMN04487996_107119 [Dyadobacter soli]
MSLKPEDVYNAVKHYKEADFKTEEERIHNLMTAADLCLKERVQVPASLVQELADGLWSRTSMRFHPMRVCQCGQEKDLDCHATAEQAVEDPKEYVDQVIKESIDCSTAEGKQMLHVEITVSREGNDIVREAKVNGKVRWSERVWINAWVRDNRPRQFMDEVEQFFNPKDRI